MSTIVACGLMLVGGLVLGWLASEQWSRRRGSPPEPPRLVDHPPPVADVLPFPKERPDE